MNPRCSRTIATVRWVGKDVPDEIGFPLIVERLKQRMRLTERGCWEYIGFVLPSGGREAMDNIQTDIC